MNDFRLNITIPCEKYLSYGDDRDWHCGGGIFQEGDDVPAEAVKTVFFKFHTFEQLDKFIADAKKMFERWAK